MKVRTDRGVGRSLLLTPVLVIALVSAALITAGVVSGADQPSISSDQSDYAPGDSVALSGSG